MLWERHPEGGSMCLGELLKGSSLGWGWPLQAQEEHMKRHRKAWPLGPHRKLWVVGESVRSVGRVKDKEAMEPKSWRPHVLCRRNSGGFYALGSGEAMGALKKGDELTLFVLWENVSDSRVKERILSEGRRGGVWLGAPFPPTAGVRFCRLEPKQPRRDDVRGISRVRLTAFVAWLEVLEGQCRSFRWRDWTDSTNKIKHKRQTRAWGRQCVHS